MKRVAAIIILVVAAGACHPAEETPGAQTCSYSTGGTTTTWVQPLNGTDDDPCVNPQRCEEDMPCWDCTTMGNRICGRP